MQENMTNLTTIEENIQNKIHTIRGVQVMLDRDLAELYWVKTKVLNQAVKRNIERFPEDFMFQLTDDEKNRLVTNCDRLVLLKHSTVNPYVFTEEWVYMLSTVLKSKIAIEVNIAIFRAFSKMRKFLLSNAYIFQRIDKANQAKRNLRSDIRLRSDASFDTEGRRTQFICHCGKGLQFRRLQ